MKIINILHHSSSPFYRDWNFDLYCDDWHVITAKSIRELTDKYDIECWRPETKLKELVCGNLNGIVYKAFPSKYVKINREYSPAMLKELKNESRKEDILIHLHGFHNDLHYLVLLKSKSFPVVASHLGGYPYTYSWHTLISRLPLSIIEPKLLRNVDKVLVSSPWIAENMPLCIHDKLMLCFPIGIDFKKVEPGNKRKIRESLNLPMDEKLMIHVGRFNRAKGLDIALKAFNLLKPSGFKLVAIGGNESDGLGKDLIRSGAIVRERIPHSELIDYYRASDIYLLPKFYSSSLLDKLGMFGGIGVSSLEALACGTPVVGTNLIHFLGTNKELEKIGRIPKNFDNLVECIRDLSKKQVNPQDCHNITRKYYDKDSIANKIIGLYDDLFDRYFGS